MELTYIYHSGFVVESDRCVLIFDYWMDPANVIERFVNPASHKHIYVFVSHFHRDHFNKEIFQWKDENTFSQFTYLLSRDILDRHLLDEHAADAWLEKSDTWHDDNIRVTATGSNDSGVSWVVELDGKRIFHAGDLCNWYARFLADDTPETIYSSEIGIRVNPVEEERRFLNELDDISKVNQSFDIAMVPVDGRIGNGYTLGARQFIGNFKVKLLVPMHFVMSGFESAWRMAPYCDDVGVTFWNIRRSGESISLINDSVIRQASINDLPQLMNIFTKARQHMVSHGNPKQWTNGYPNEQLIREDIESKDCYACLQGNKIVATFVLREGVDPTYEIIEDGTWPNNDPYATIHRIATDGEVKGIVNLSIKFALQHHSTLRIDTHRDNIVMQRAIQKEGFKYCGLIHCGDHSNKAVNQSFNKAHQEPNPDTERLAYILSQKV